MLFLGPWQEDLKAWTESREKGQQFLKELRAEADAAAAAPPRPAPTYGYDPYARPRPAPVPVREPVRAPAPVDPAVVRAEAAVEQARTQTDRPTRMALEPGAIEVALKLDANTDEDYECSKCGVPIPVGGSTLRLRRRGAIAWVAPAGAVVRTRGGISPSPRLPGCLPASSLH